MMGAGDGTQGLARQTSLMGLLHPGTLCGALIWSLDQVPCLLSEGLSWNFIGKG